jgi:hypothetical protein
MSLRVFRQTRSGDEIIQLAVRLALPAFLLYWSFVLVRPFIPMLAWSVVLTVALYTPYNWLAIHLGGRPKLAAAQILVVPDLEAGNMLAKNLAYFAKADGAGIVLGARVPIVLTSRADSPRARMASCAVATLYADARRRRSQIAAA